MATIVTINSTDLITNSRADLNTNFANLNSDKIETSVIDTDTAMAANSDAKIPSQKAVKTYIDTQGGANASTTVRGVVEEATSAEMIAGTATGGTGARLFINPTLVAETGADKIVKTKSTGLLDSSIVPVTSVDKVVIGTTEVSITAGAGGENTLFTGAIPANTLSTNNALRFRAYFSSLRINSGTTLTLRVKYGGTTFATHAFVLDSGELRGELDGMIVADGSTSLQKAFSRATMWTNNQEELATDAAVGITKLLGYDHDMALAINSTSSQNLVITAQYSATGANDNLTFDLCTVEVIQ